MVFDIKQGIEEQQIEVPVDEGTDMTDFESATVETGVASSPPTTVDYDRLKIGSSPFVHSIRIVILSNVGFLIAVAYSAAVGGMGTLVGTGPNIFVKGFTDE